ncbi:MAG: hypothetical protein E5X26_11495 [Mesorhizobium sp.]|nr:MAG: hypothetical protein E5X26_11495 [Mesorhizobium sp.]
MRAARRQEHREALERSASRQHLRKACDKATRTLVRRFLKTGHVDERPKKNKLVQRRLLKANIGKTISSTKVALWVFDLRWHGGLGIMDAYRQTAQDLRLTEKQVRDCFSQHSEELDQHQSLFTLQ